MFHPEVALEEKVGRVAKVVLVAKVAQAPICFAMDMVRKTVKPLLMLYQEMVGMVATVRMVVMGALVLVVVHLVSTV